MRLYMPRNLGSRKRKVEEQDLAMLQAQVPPVVISAPPAGNLLSQIPNDTTRLITHILPAYTLRNLSITNRRWYHEVKGKSANLKRANSLPSIISSCKTPDDAIAILADDTLCSQFTLAEMMKVISLNPDVLKAIINNNEISSQFEIIELLKICQLSDNATEIVLANPLLHAKISTCYFPLPSPVGAELLEFGKKSEKAAKFVLSNPELCRMMKCQDLIEVAGAHDSTAQYLYHQYKIDPLLSKRTFSKAHIHRLVILNKKAGDLILKDDKRCQALTEDDITDLINGFLSNTNKNGTFSQAFYSHPIIGPKLSGEQIKTLGMNFPQLALSILSDDKVRPLLTVNELVSLGRRDVNAALKILRDREFLDKICSEPGLFIALIISHKDLAKYYFIYCNPALQRHEDARKYFENNLPNLLDDPNNKYQVLLACAPFNVFLSIYLKDVEAKKAHLPSIQELFFKLAMTSEENALKLLSIPSFKAGTMNVPVSFYAEQLIQMGIKYENVAKLIVKMKVGIHVKQKLGAKYKSVAEILIEDKDFVDHAYGFDEIYALAKTHKVFAKRMINSLQYHIGCFSRKNDKFPYFPLTEVAILYPDLSNDVLSKILSTYTTVAVRGHVQELLRTNRRLFHETLNNPVVNRFLMVSFFNENFNIPIRSIPHILGSTDLKSLLNPKMLKRFQLALDIFKAVSSIAKAQIDSRKSKDKIEPSQICDAPSMQATCLAATNVSHKRARQEDEEDEIVLAPAETTQPAEDEALLEMLQAESEEINEAVSSSMQTSMKRRN